MKESSQRDLTLSEKNKLLHLLKAGSQEAAAVTWSSTPYLVSMESLIGMVKL